jgi:signal transduction histidine kinase
MTLRYNRTTSFHSIDNRKNRFYKEKTMQETSPQYRKINDLFIPLFVLSILTVYTYGILLVVPYPGFAFNTSNGRVIEIYSPQTPNLQINDILVQIGPVSWESYKKDSWLVLFEGVQKGETVEITVKRNDTEKVIPWKFAGFDQDVFKTRLFNTWVLAFVFWFAGTAAQILIRPKDERRRLFIAANYLTALWLIFGTLSSRHLWGSSILLHAVTWLFLPVYLHFHWLFPRPLKELPKAVWILIYLTGFVFAGMEFIQVLPKSLYALAFLGALGGSILLEGLHYIRQADQRRTVLMLALAILIAFIPSVGLGILVLTRSLPDIGPVALFALPIMPLAYFYVIFRRQLGGLEVRFNRFISLYAFLILVGTALMFLIVPLTDMEEISHQALILLGGLAFLAVVYLTIVIFPAFQVFVDKRFLGITLPHQNLQETYSARISTSTSTASLLHLLEKDVFPSLLVRQYAVMQFSNGNLKALLTKNIIVNQLPKEKDIERLTSRAGKYAHNFSSDNEWIRLILPLKAGDSLIGFWLLGQRDPDDLYSQVEIPILQAIANQTAIALSNILRAEEVKAMYQADIERYEKERMRLALELHDNILNQIAFLRSNIDDTHLSPKFQTAYDELIHRLRDIVSDLRPAMLMYGLKSAIEELADNLMERSGDKIKIHVDIEASEERVPENIEKHLYRIVQEACENSLRYSNAQRIGIFGKLTPLKIDLVVEDDGDGFEMEPEMNSLIAKNHFGLAGMIERARLIDAEISFQSAPNAGVKIYISWSGS